jgi:hypothetical protein
MSERPSDAMLRFPFDRCPKHPSGSPSDDQKIASAVKGGETRPRQKALASMRLVIRDTVSFLNSESILTAQAEP